MRKKGPISSGGSARNGHCIFSVDSSIATVIQALLRSNTTCSQSTTSIPSIVSSGLRGGGRGE